MRLKADLLVLWLTWALLGAFLLGFFPVKRPLPDAAANGDIPQEARSVWLAGARRPIVVVLIDALRADFVLDADQLKEAGVDFGDSREERAKIPFLRELLHNGQAIGFVAKATPPTVTLPRIKALTTGSIPGFVDVALNFGSSQLQEDSLITQWAANGRNLTMFGDDTWIKLFPKSFMRYDGTTSFFVSDYTEVDENVTRHLPSEMSKSDWDVSVLHYLGLDHIGHLRGPSSELIKPKLEEMSTVLQTIYEALASRRETYPHEAPLMIVLGDHGMSDAGSHGGASLAETLTPIVVIRPGERPMKRKVSYVDQQDLAPSLAFLTGVAIPKNNLGCLISTLIDVKGSVEQNDASLAALWYYNAQQVAKVVKANGYDTASGYVTYLEAEEAFKTAAYGISIRLFKASLVQMKALLAENLLEYSIGIMFGAIGCSTLLLIAYAWSILGDLLRMMKNTLTRTLLVCETVRIFSLAATSFIEEEHQTAYFLALSYLLYAYYAQILQGARDKRPKGKLFILLGLFRLFRQWNQTGDKWAHLPDNSDWLLEEDHRFWLSLLHFASLAFLACRAVQFQAWLAPIGLTFIYMHNAAKGLVLWGPVSQHSWTRIFGDREGGVLEAQLVYALVIVTAMLSYHGRCCYKFLFGCLMPVLALLTSPNNTVLLPFLVIFWESVSKCNASQPVLVKVLLCLSLGKSVFFMQGNSNSLATVDVGAGYTGVPYYQPFLVSVLMAVNTYGAPIAAIVMLSMKLLKEEYEVFVSTSILFHCLEVLFFVVVVTSQRHHLFVWTVFSPKLLYLFTWTAVLAFVLSLTTLFKSESALKTKKML